MISIYYPRFDVAPAASAAVAIWFLQDLIAAGHPSPTLDHLACDHNKVRRAIEVAMSQSMEKDKERLDWKEITGLEYDGGKNTIRLFHHSTSCSTFL